MVWWWPLFWIILVYFLVFNAHEDSVTSVCPVQTQSFGCSSDSIMGLIEFIRLNPGKDKKKGQD